METKRKELRIEFWRTFGGQTEDFLSFLDECINILGIVTQKL